MKLYDAIYVRKSIRKFQMTPLDNGQMERIHQFIQNVQPLFSNLSYQMKIVSLSKRIKGYFIVKAPYYLIFSGVRGEDAYNNAGYMLEQVVLYLTSKGIGTCYQGCAKIADQSFDQPETMEPLMVVAFGKPKDEWDRDQTDRKRMSVDDLTRWETGQSDVINLILDAAVHAPSSFNSQPWRFIVEKTGIHIFKKCSKRFLFSMQRMNTVDIGICIGHIMVAAEELWLNATVEKCESFSEKGLKNWQYIATIKMERN